MFETLSLLELQQYWWAVISMLAAFLISLMFVQGGQMMAYRLGKTAEERTMIYNALGRKWELTFTTLVTFGGSFFASFPMFYATSFGGAFWLWMIILFAFIIQAISYEYRSKPNNFLGAATYEKFLYTNGFVGTFLIGVAVGTFYNGSLFSINRANIANLYGSLSITQWQNPWHGLEALLNLHNVALGLSVFFLARILGILFIVYSVNNDAIFSRAKKLMIRNTIPFLIFFLGFVIYLLLKDGFAYDSVTYVVTMEEYKYLHNFMDMPLVAFFFIVGVVLVLLGIGRLIFSNYKFGFWFTSIGTFLTVFTLLLVAGYNNTAYYPSIYNLQHSLSIENSSSSRYTLVVMGYASLMVPFVIAYIAYVWNKLTRKPIDQDEIDGQSHVY